MEHGADKDKANEIGCSPLFMACQDGHEGTARLLLEHGADKDKARVDGSTPLCMACQMGHLSIVVLLGKAGADLSLQWTRRDGQKFTAEESVAYVLSENYHNPQHRKPKHPAILRWLQAVRRFTPLHWACVAGDAARALALIRAEGVAAVRTKARFAWPAKPRPAPTPPCPWPHASPATAACPRSPR